MCVPRRGHTPNQSEDHELSPFSKPSGAVMLSCRSTRVENVAICESKKRYFHTFPCCNTQPCWSFDAANNVFFPVVPRMNVVTKKKKRQPVKGYAKDVAVGYLLMWCGTQPTPTRQYVSLLWWWARKCPHPPTDWKVCVPSIVTLWIFWFCRQFTEGGLPPRLKWQKKTKQKKQTKTKPNKRVNFMTVIC